MNTEIRDAAFDPWSELAAYQSRRSMPRGSCGATACFVGTMRDLNEGDGVAGMRLEHYPGMTDTYLQQLAEEAKLKWGLLDMLVIHRAGELAPGDPIVLVAAWSRHRAAAFEACRAVMERLKSEAPFWKKEFLAGGGERWVEHNTPG